MSTCFKELVTEGFDFHLILNCIARLMCTQPKMNNRSLMGKGKMAQPWLEVHG